MAESEQCILIVQSDDSQRLIWERVLQSQKLAVDVDSSGRSPLVTLAHYRARGKQFDLALVDWRLLQREWLGWSALCARQTPALKTMLLLPERLDPVERQAALESGAADTIAWVSHEDPVASVIAGTRRILEQLDDVSMDRDALVDSLVEFKRLLANPKPSPAELSDSLEGGSPPAPDASPSADNEKPNAQDLSNLDNPKRRYRGQTY